MKRKTQSYNNLAELSKQEIQNIELGILKYLTDFCEANNVNYILSDGTLLGAVRHKGFIPWDLDIDISMLRSDYDRFLDLWKDTEDYALISIKNIPECALPFAKIVDMHTICYEGSYETIKGGVWVDIFPLDAVPDNKDEIELHWKKILILRDSFGRLSNIYRHKFFFGRFLRRLKYALFFSDFSCFWESILTRYKRLIDESEKYNSRNYNNVTNNMVIIRRPENRKYGFPKQTLLDFIYAPFEKFSFRIPKDYDPLLRSYYGNYMELPPEDKRVDDHNLRVYKTKIIKNE